LPWRTRITIRLLSMSAMLCDARGERVRALALLRGVLSALEKAFGQSHDALLPVLADLARVQAGLGDHLGARELVERIGSVRAASAVPDPLGRACDLMNLSDSHRQLGDVERGWSLAGQALSTARPSPARSVWFHRESSTLEWCVQGRHAATTPPCAASLPRSIRPRAEASQSDFGTSARCSPRATGALTSAFNGPTRSSWKPAWSSRCAASGSSLSLRNPEA
jgi:hypothetical protein